LFKQSGGGWVGSQKVKTQNIKSMTKKDYKKFADIIVKVQKRGDDSIPLYELNDDLIDILSEDNSRFDVEKWDEYIEKELKK